jgi:hypothetical protein
MSNPITVHGSYNGGTYAVTINKTGSNTASVRVQQLTPATSDHTVTVSHITANAAGTELACQGPFGISATCTLDNSTPANPVAHVSAFGQNATAQTTPVDYAALTQYIVACQFPSLTS